MVVLVVVVVVADEAAGPTGEPSCCDNEVATGVVPEGNPEQARTRGLAAAGALIPGLGDVMGESVYAVGIVVVPVVRCAAAAATV